MSAKTAVLPDRKITRDDIEAKLQELRGEVDQRAEAVKVRYSAEISADPKDDAFCLCAESGNADFIVTLNPKDFPEECLKSKIVPPSELIG